jgi:tetratricopeptide (TPR) repeat protein
MTRRLFYLIAVVLTLGSSPVAQASPETDFAAANQAYTEGRFADAVSGYENVVGAGNWHANVFYDLGNAFYRLGNFGKAILNYERALALDPRHPEAEANLRLAQEEARALELRKTWMERYAGMATLSQYSIAAMVALWLAIFLFLHWYFDRRRSWSRRALIGLCILVCAASAFGIFTLENGVRGEALAIVTGKDTEARVATADSAKSILLLPPGSEIKVLSERGDWIYVSLPNEQRGWIPASSAERVRL